MKLLIRNSELATIYEKVIAGERLSFQDGIILMRSDDILFLGYLADICCQRKNNNKVYFTCNININPTNICVNRCKLCAFSRNLGEQGAYTLTLKDIDRKVDWALLQGIYEFHIVGGLNPELPLEYYEDMLRLIKSKAKNIFIQAFTAVEVEFFSRLSALTIEEVLLRLRAAGLGALPGGGAEIFSPRVRAQICENKISGDKWLQIMRTAHKLGIKSNATMLYGHLETIQERIEHLIALRDLQDETGGFCAFVPLPFHSQNTGLNYLPATTTAYDDLKVVSVARLILDNFSHIKLLWSYVGEKLAQVALNFGVDDLGGLSLDERIAHAAGAEAPVEISKEKLSKIIEAARKQPIQANSIYEPC